MTPRRQRMLMVSLVILGVSVAAWLGLQAFQKNMLYFFTPTQVAAGEAPKGFPFRVGGLVVRGSVQRPGGVVVEFGLTDGPASITVHYEGILPDLFREGQGIIAVGQMNDAQVFVASEVLAKHDENYMPPEVGDALKKSGQLPENYRDYQK